MKFWSLYWTQFLGALNDNLLKNAMVLMITYRALGFGGLDAPSIVALSGAIFILPFFLFSMLAGELADKYEKSCLVRLVKVWEILIALVAAIGFMTQSVGTLLLTLFMMGVHSTFFGPIKYSAIPDLVPPDRLISANAHVEMGTFLAILLGTIGGASLVSQPHGEAIISFAVCACAATGYLMSRRIPPLPSLSPHPDIRLNPMTPIAETFRLLRETPLVIHAIVGISWFWFFGAAVLSILAPYCKDFLKVNENVVTLFLAMFTLGSGLGSILCARMCSRGLRMGPVVMGSLGLTVFLFDLSFVAEPGRAAGGGSLLMTLSEFLHTSYGPRLAFDFLMMSVAGGFFILPLYTTMQVRCRPDFRSRVIAGNNVLNAVFMVASSVLVMAFHLWGVSWPRTLLTLAVVNLAFTVAAAVQLLRLRQGAKITRFV